MEQDTVKLIFGEEDSSSPSILGLRNGLDKVCILKVRLNYLKLAESCLLFFRLRASHN